MADPIIVVMLDKQPKKHSVRYNAEKEDDPVSSIYIRNEAVIKLGNPGGVKITIEAVE